MTNAGYYRFATICGDRIVFVCEDDLWTVDVRGGTAQRLTNAVGDCVAPRLSPDGKLIAFTCMDEGHPEVFVVPSAGGIPQRLTYLGSEVAQVAGWTPDGEEILFYSEARAPFFKHTELFAVSPWGGAPRSLDLGHARAIAMDKKGRIALGRNSQDTAWWKRYRGGTAGEIWIDSEANGQFRRLLAFPGNMVSPMLVGDRVYFASDHQEIANIYSCLLDGSNLKRHTDHTEYFVRYPSTDGLHIVYTAGGTIHTLECSTGRVEALNVSTPSPMPLTARKFVEASSHLEHYSIHPRGHSVGIIARGQPLTMPLFEGAAVQHGAGSAVRYRHLEWLPDGVRFVTVQDRDNFERVELHHTDAADSTDLITSDDIGRVVEMLPSPKGELLAITNHRYELLLVDLRSKALRRLDKSPAERISGPAWSPDGKWLAYSFPLRLDTRIIRIANCESGAIHDATSPLRSDWSPSFDPDGKYLFFLSSRDFSPIYDAQQFELSFPLSVRPYLVTLRKDVASPMAPRCKPMLKDTEQASAIAINERRKSEIASADRDKTVQNAADPERSSHSPASAPHLEPPASVAEDHGLPALHIDFEGLPTRMIALPIDEARMGVLAAAPGRILFLRYPVKGIGRDFDWQSKWEEAGDLVAFDLEERKTSIIHENLNSFRLGPDGRTLVCQSRERLRVIDAKQPPDKSLESAPPGWESGWLDLSRAAVMVEPVNEWEQMYRESWRLQNEHFWNEQMSDVDWSLVFERYALLLPRIRSRTELSDLIWEMQGELGTSHAYEFGGDHRVPRSYKRGFLGADLHFDPETGGYKIVKIHRGDVWDQDADSPLAEPGLNIQVGDVIMAVNGRQVSRQLSVDELLMKMPGKHVQLTIKQGTNTRHVTVRALKSERFLRYRAWVESNRALVHERTNAKIGYLHVPDMGPAGFAEFHRGYLSEYHRDGLIVDVRYNRGGHVSALLLEKLSRKRVGYDVSRWGAPQPYPSESVAGPLVAVTNQFAGSDGDIFSHCFKLYGLGPLVGKRTWGGVVGIWPRHRLVDETLTTQPEFSFWFRDVGWSVENYGTDPNVEVDFAPHHYARKEDPQLDKAIDLALDALRENPVQLPDFSKRPSLRLPAYTCAGARVEREPGQEPV